MNLYLFWAKGMFDEYISEGKVVIVKAKSKGCAKLKFAEVYPRTDEDFIESIYDRSMNMSFAERFWITDQNNDHFMQTGEVLTTEEEFKANVFAFFGVLKEWADLYIENIFSEETPIPYPPEMISFMFLKDNFDENFCCACISDIPVYCT